MCLESSHLEELVQVLLQVFDEVGVEQFGQDELFDLLRERNLRLSQPRPVERVYTEQETQTEPSVMCFCWNCTFEKSNCATKSRALLKKSDSAKNAFQRSPVTATGITIRTLRLGVDLD